MWILHTCVHKIRMWRSRGFVKTSPVVRERQTDRQTEREKPRKSKLSTNLRGKEASVRM